MRSVPRAAEPGGWERLVVILIGMEIMREGKEAKLPGPYGGAF